MKARCLWATLWTALYAALCLQARTAAAADAPPPLDGTPTVDSTCLDDSQVVGRSKCRRYGDPWGRFASQPPLQGRVGASYYRYPISILRFGDGARMLNLPAHEVDLATPAMMVRLAVTTGYFHIGFEGAFASDQVDREPLRGPGVEVDITHAFYVTGGLVGGLGIRLGPLLVRGEVLWGGRRTTVRLIERVHGMVSEATDARWVFEPRLSLEAFLTPWIAAGVWGGIDTLSEGAQSYGLFLEGKLRAFDGATGSPW